jgi:hypothetical protein
MPPPTLKILFSYSPVLQQCLLLLLQLLLVTLNITQPLLLINNFSGTLTVLGDCLLAGPSSAPRCVDSLFIPLVSLSERTSNDKVEYRRKSADVL